MKTMRRLISFEVVMAVGFVTLGFLSLFSFFDLVDQLPAIGRPALNEPLNAASAALGQVAGAALGAAYQLPQALTYVALLIPTHLYELLPMTVLIGTIYVMTRLAQSSEFTILRTSGLGPWRALRTLLWTGVGFALLTFAMGDYLAPWADRTAQLLKARYEGNLSVGQTGAWLKEKQAYGQFAVNINALTSDGRMRGVRIYEFDNQGRLVSFTSAETGQFEENEAWLLQQVRRTEFNRTDRVDRSEPVEFRWRTAITADMASAAVLRPDRMSTLDLYDYIRHLNHNNQAADRYEIEFWKKVFYPISCLVMVVLALPFAYLHFRTAGISGYMFLGVIVGISFFFLNILCGYIGEIQRWEPWFTAALPCVIYIMISLSAFGWLVLRR
jgi:lipopolysaccharide export system permease protein